MRRYTVGDRVRVIGALRAGTVTDQAGKADMAILGGNLAGGPQMGDPAEWCYVRLDGDDFSALHRHDWLRPADQPDPPLDRYGWPVLPWHRRIQRWLIWRRVDGSGFVQRRWHVAWLRIRFGPDPEF